MGSYLKTAKGLMGALIAKKAFEDEELEFQLQEKERQLQEKEKIIGEVKAKWKEYIAGIYEGRISPISRPSVFVDGVFTDRRVSVRYPKSQRESRPNNNLIITLRGDRGSARVYKWANGHWRFIVCLPKRNYLIHRVFKDRKRCFTAAKEYIFRRAKEPLPVLLEGRYEPGAKMVHIGVDRYVHVYQPLDTFYDYKAHEIELRGYTGGDDFDFIYWYTKGVNDAMDDTCKWDKKYNKNLDL